VRFRRALVESSLLRVLADGVDRATQLVNRADAAVDPYVDQSHLARDFTAFEHKVSHGE
jgi:hypothetical protein